MSDNKNPFREYVIVGRKKPSESDSNPKVFRMRIFASNPVVARARFWYFTRMLQKLKRVNGEILATHEIVEDNHKIQNFGIWVRYQTRRLTINGYYEERATTRSEAISQLYQNMAGRHRARATTIHIIDIKPLKATECVRPHVTQFHSTKLKFPLPHRVLKVPHQKSKTFLASRPSTHMG